MVLVNGYDAPWFKTSLCAHHAAGRCYKTRKQCAYAHGRRDLRAAPPKPCHALRDHGWCPYGEACQYASSHALLIVDGASSTRADEPATSVDDASSTQTSVDGASSTTSTSEVLGLLSETSSLLLDGPWEPHGSPWGWALCTGCDHPMVEGTTTQRAVCLPCGHAKLCGVCARKQLACRSCGHLVSLVVPLRMR